MLDHVIPLKRLLPLLKQLFHALAKIVNDELLVNFILLSKSQCTSYCDGFSFVLLHIKVSSSSSKMDRRPLCMLRAVFWFCCLMVLLPPLHLTGYWGSACGLSLAAELTMPLKYLCILTIFHTDLFSACKDLYFYKWRLLASNSLGVFWSLWFLFASLSH